MELKDLKVAEAVKLFKQKKLSPVEYTKSIIDEVRKHWDLNTVVNLNEEIAVRNAEESEKRYANGSELSKIDGIPIGIKDIIDTKEIITTYGCKGYREHYPKEDAFVIRKLKEAGAFKTWIFKILSAKIAQKKKEYVNKSVDIGEIPEPEDEKSSLLQEDASIRSLFFSLPREDRTILSLNIFMGYGSEEISEILGIPAGTVRSRKKRALDKLRSEL